MFGFHRTTGRRWSACVVRWLTMVAQDVDESPSSGHHRASRWWRQWLLFQIGELAILGIGLALRSWGLCLAVVVNSVAVLLSKSNVLKRGVPLLYFVGFLLAGYVELSIGRQWLGLSFLLALCIASLFYAYILLRGRKVRPAGADVGPGPEKTPQ